METKTENIVIAEGTNFNLAHVARFDWDPLTPVVLMIDEYAASVSLTDEQAYKLGCMLVNASQIENVGEK